MPRTIIPPALAVLLAGVVPLFAQPTPLLTPEPVDKLIAVLKSDAPHKAKADACRQLSIRGTKEVVPALAALLGDEKLSHMARYGLEPILDPSVDDALRDALGNLKGRPLVGVIVSLGVRRDAKAVEPLAKFLHDANVDVAQAAARSLGRIATPEAVRVLEAAQAAAPAANQLAVCEGLFRAADALAAKGERELVVKVYDRLRGLKQAPHQVRTGAVRGAILARGKDGLPLLGEYLASKDCLLFAAAVRTTYEMRGPEVTQSLIGAAEKTPPTDQQILLIQAISKRADPAALPVLSALAKGGPQEVRFAAVRALAENAKRPTDKAILLAALGTMASPESLGLIVPYLDDAGAKGEAVAAALSVAENLLKDRNAGDVAAKLIGPLEKVVQGASPNQVQRAKAALGEARRKAGKK